MWIIFIFIVLEIGGGWYNPVQSCSKGFINSIQSSPPTGTHSLSNEINWPKYVSKQTPPKITIFVVSVEYNDKEHFFVNITTQKKSQTTCYCSYSRKCTYNQKMEWDNVSEFDADNVWVELFDHNNILDHHSKGLAKISLLPYVSTNQDMNDMTVSVKHRILSQNGSIQLQVRLQVTLELCKLRDSAEGNCASGLDDPKCLRLQGNNTCIEDPCPSFYQKDWNTNTCELLDCADRIPEDGSCLSVDDNPDLPACGVSGGSCVPCFPQHYHNYTSVCELKDCPERIPIASATGFLYPCGGDGTDCFLQPTEKSCRIKCPLNYRQTAGRCVLKNCKNREPEGSPFLCEEEKCFLQPPGDCDAMCPDNYTGVNGVCFETNCSCYNTTCVLQPALHYISNSTAMTCELRPCEDRWSSGAVDYPCAIGGGENDNCSLQYDGTCAPACLDFTEDKEGNGICTVLNCTERKPVEGKCSFPNDPEDRCSLQDGNCVICPMQYFVFRDGECCNIQPNRSSCELNCPHFYVSNTRGQCVMETCEKRTPHPQNRLCRISSTEPCGFLNGSCTSCSHNYNLNSDGECELKNCTDRTSESSTTNAQYACVEDGCFLQPLGSCDTTCPDFHEIGPRGICIPTPCTERTPSDRRSCQSLDSFDPENDRCGSLSDSDSNSSRVCVFCPEAHFYNDRGVCTLLECSLRTQNNTAPHVCGTSNCRPVPDDPDNACYEEKEVSAPSGSMLMIVIIVCVAFFVAFIIISVIILAIYLSRKRKRRNKSKIGGMEEIHNYKQGDGGGDEGTGIASEESREEGKLSANPLSSSSSSLYTSSTNPLFSSSSSLSSSHSTPSSSTIHSFSSHSTPSSSTVRSLSSSHSTSSSSTVRSISSLIPAGTSTKPEKTKTKEEQNSKKENHTHRTTHTRTPTERSTSSAHAGSKETSTKHLHTSTGTNKEEEEEEKNTTAPPSRSSTLRNNTQHVVRVGTSATFPPTRKKMQYHLAVVDTNKNSNRADTTDETNSITTSKHHHHHTKHKSFSSSSRSDTNERRKAKSVPQLVLLSSGGGDVITKPPFEIGSVTNSTKHNKRSDSNKALVLSSSSSSGSVKNNTNTTSIPQLMLSSSSTPSSVSGGVPCLSLTPGGVGVVGVADIVGDVEDEDDSHRDHVDDWDDDMGDDHIDMMENPWDSPKRTHKTKYPLTDATRMGSWRNAPSTTTMTTNGGRKSSLGMNRMSMTSEDRKRRLGMIRGRSMEKKKKSEKGKDRRNATEDWEGSGF